MSEFRPYTTEEKVKRGTYPVNKICVCGHDELYEHEWSTEECDECTCKHFEWNNKY